MLTQSLLLLGQLNGRNLAQCGQALGLGGGSRQQFPSADALQSATGLAFLAGGAQQTALGIAEETFEVSSQNVGAIPCGRPVGQAQGTAPTPNY